MGPIGKHQNPPEASVKTGLIQIFDKLTAIQAFEKNRIQKAGRFRSSQRRKFTLHVVEGEFYYLYGFEQRSTTMHAVAWLSGPTSSFFSTQAS